MTAHGATGRRGRFFHHPVMGQRGTKGLRVRGWERTPRVAPGSAICPGPSSGRMPPGSSPPTPSRPGRPPGGLPPIVNVPLDHCASVGRWPGRRRPCRSQRWQRSWPCESRPGSCGPVPAKCDISRNRCAHRLRGCLDYHRVSPPLCFLRPAQLACPSLLLLGTDIDGSNVLGVAITFNLEMALLLVEADTGGGEYFAGSLTLGV